MAKRILSTGSSATAVSTSLSELSFGQKSRFNYLSSIFEDETTVINIVKHIEPRGQNNWAQLNEKLHRIANADSQGRVYHNAINQAFEIDEEYTSDDIIKIIGDIRRRLNMPTHIGRLKRYCEDDFFTVFMIHDVVTTTSIGKKRASRSDVIAFKPIISLMQAY
ncbi:hypothetical protein SRABI27_04228 [Pedobacter sp. Bi27]|uniref:hypothetical protein n=1 Tax=Pedobacter sp. Bi27 TaxID=2822351 RepID=UPI001DE521D8|nr:hypothetical protein [Pedobacter sp. Bi27]CAH0296239.1 hypothetical protein SRABI27_04228 [Pedobacter sp. Bi27]